MLNTTNVLYSEVKPQQEYDGVNKILTGLPDPDINLKSPMA